MKKLAILGTAFLCASAAYAGPTIPGARFTDTLNMNTNIIEGALSLQGVDTNTATASILHWNGEEGVQAWEFSHPDGGTVTINGETYREWKNADSVAITNGQPVALTGGTGRVGRIVLADADDSDRNSVVGIYTGTDVLAPDAIGRITRFGDVKGFDLAAQTIEGGVLEDTEVYLSTTPGMYTTNMPSAPTEIIKVGECSYAHEVSGTYDLVVAVENIKPWGLLDGRFPIRSEFEALEAEVDLKADQTNTVGYIYTETIGGTNYVSNLKYDFTNGVLYVEVKATLE